MAVPEKCILCGIGTIIWVYQVNDNETATVYCPHCGASGEFNKAETSEDYIESDVYTRRTTPPKGQWLAPYRRDRSPRNKESLLEKLIGNICRVKNFGIVSRWLKRFTPAPAPAPGPGITLVEMIPQGYGRSPGLDAISAILNVPNLLLDDIVWKNDYYNTKMLTTA
jgi:hypothetical protein